MKTWIKGDRNANEMEKRKQTDKISSKVKKILSLREALVHAATPKWVILILLCLSIAFLVSHKTLSRVKQYGVGDVAESNIKADVTFLVKDTASTAEREQQARDAVPAVFDYDPVMFKKISTKLHATFETTRNALSQENEADNPEGELPENGLGQSLVKWNQDLGLDLDAESFEILEGGGFSEDVENLILFLVEPVFRQGLMATKQDIYVDRGRGIIVRNIVTKEEEHVADLDGFPSLRQARQGIESRAADFLRQYKYPSLMLSVRIAQDLLAPNLILNKVEWDRRKDRAAENLKPVYYKIKKHEMIVREGEKITQRRIDELAALAVKQSEGQVWIRFFGLSLLLGMLVYVASESVGQMMPRLRLNSKDLLFLGIVVFMGFLVVLPAGYVGSFDPDLFIFPLTSTLYSAPLTLGSMLASIFLGVPVAIMVSVVIAFIAALVIQNSIHFFVYFLVGGFIAAISVQDCRDRSVLLKAGLLVGLSNIFLAVALNMVTDSLFTQAAIYDVSFALLGGVIAGIIVTGLTPLGEMTFGYTTNIKLLELANLDSPILKQLMIVAPGTYHHSLIAGTLVEAAGKAIGANSLLCKVAAYYHDLGKIKKPDYFIENQTGRNRHEKLAPSMSALILISHVKEGVELARKNRLGNAIIDIIQQHHGTTIISYFYQKAKELKGQQDQASLSEADFRYPGPKPQTKEAGLVLLADVVEAASHTLQNPNPARVQGMVQKIINKAFSDGQLDQCELTLKDLHEVAKSFNQILNGIFHQRIEYPEPVEKGAAQAKSKDGGISRQPAASARDRKAEPQVQDQENLKRLGL